MGMLQVIVKTLYVKKESNKKHKRFSCCLIILILKYTTIILIRLKAVIVFIDFKKAFDIVHRVKMLKILKAYGIPDRLISAIGLMYEGTQARVITPDGEAEFFSIRAAVLQWDTLAPYLFAIILDYAMGKAV